MKDEKFIRYVHELTADYARDLTDEDIDKILASVPEEPESERDETAWPKFVRTVLSNLYDEPRRSKGRYATLGDFLKEARKATNFTQADVAAALGKDIALVERIESDRTPLSSLDPTDTADLACLLSIHIKALKDMLPRQIHLPPSTGGSRGLLTMTPGVSMRISDTDAQWLEEVRRVLKVYDRGDLIN